MIDLASGRFQASVQNLTLSIATAREAHASWAVARRQMALAHAHLGSGNLPAAVDAVHSAFSAMRAGDLGQDLLRACGAHALALGLLVVAQ